MEGGDVRIKQQRQPLQHMMQCGYPQRGPGPLQPAWGDVIEIACSSNVSHFEFWASLRQAPDRYEHFIMALPPVAYPAPESILRYLCHSKGVKHTQLPNRTSIGWTVWGGSMICILYNEDRHVLTVKKMDRALQQGRKQGSQARCNNSALPISTLLQCTGCRNQASVLPCYVNTNS